MQGCALADLLVGGEGDAELAVGAALGKEDLGGGQNLCHTGLVVCAQQGGAVGGDQSLTLEAGQDFCSMPPSASEAWYPATKF